MTQSSIKPWLEVVTLHPDVLSDEFSEDIFALDLGPLADGNPNVAAVYRDPEHFFRASYLTTGLKSLLRDVLSRLGGGAGNRVLKLITPWGDRPYSDCVASFAAAVEEERPVPVMVSSARKTLAVIEAARRSAETGEPVEIQSPEPEHL